MPVSPDILESLKLELRRGTLVLAVLGALRVERYGYTLRSALAGQGVGIDEGALYPMLRRLEAQGLLTSEWREDARRQKRFYRLSADGAAALDQLAGEWRAMNLSIENILGSAPDAIAPDVEADDGAAGAGQSDQQPSNTPIRPSHREKRS